EDVRGLQIAVDDKVAMRVRDGFADVAEEAQSLFQSKTVLLDISVEGKTVHVLHDEVGRARFRRSAVQNARDFGMLEPRQDLPLPPKTVAGRLADERRRADLERNALGENVVGAVRLEDCAHAALRNAANDAVGSDLPPFQRLFPRGQAEQISGRL